MSLMTIRHKPIRSFVWLTCFLTFYLGFNQQIMCFELSPDGGINKSHLQLIECNPLSSHAIPAKHSPGMSIPGVVTANSSANGCPSCRDFHLSFKRTSGIYFSGMGALISFLPVEYPILSNRFLKILNPIREKPIWASQFLIPKSNLSLVVLRSTILLI